MQLVGVIWLLGACVGHIAIVVFSINWWYAFPLPKRLLLFLRGLHGLIAIVGLAAFARLYLSHSDLLTDLSSNSFVRVCAALYQLFCLFVGFGIFPVLTLWRRVYRPTGILMSNHTRTVDIAAQRGFKPVGRGKYRLLARLPGNQVFKLDISERTLRLPRLPKSWDGLTIAHVSDLHFCGTPDKIFFQDVMDVCRQWDPDILALTGDFVDGGRYERWLLPVLGRLRWREAGFAILGNHDWWHDPTRIRRRLQRLKLRVLGNTWHNMEIRGTRLIVIGHEGPWFQPPPDLTACPSGAFRLCLSHTPDNISWARQHNVDLMLAGHNHGGQIRFPFIGSILVPSRYGRRYDCGTFSMPPTVLHVSRGLSGEHPLRYNCRPEITKLILTSQASGNS
jgi:predicted MPP superfamily phosphohydrolase